MSPSLLDPQFLRKLDRLELATRRTTTGQMKGERRSRKRGLGTEFADFRQYTPGDDLRAIDWNLYARLDRFFVRIFHEEQDLALHLVLDTSRSMDFGGPLKIDFALRAAAAIAYVGLTNQDKVSLACFAGGAAGSFGPSRGRHHVRRLFEYLQTVKPAGETSLLAACKEVSQRARGRSLVVVISDFLDPAGFEPALRYLVRDSIDVCALHVLAPQEIDPILGGHVELLDMETGHKVELTVNERLRKNYKENLDAYCAMIQNWCTRRGMLYTLLRTDTALEDLMLRRLREGGMVRL